MFDHPREQTRSPNSRHADRVQPAMQAPASKDCRRRARPSDDVIVGEAAMARHHRVLRRDVRPLVVCPFCDDNRGVISVDTTALVLARERSILARQCRNYETINLPLQDHDDLAFLFGITGFHRDPCLHLIELSGECLRESLDSGDGMDCWGMFAWKSTTDLVGDLEAFYWNVVQKSVEEAFQPRVLCHRENFSIRWRTDDADGEEWEYGARGYAVFVSSPAEFFMELAARHKSYRRYQKTVKAAGNW